MTIPPTMRAVLLTRHGDLDALVVVDDHPTPQPGPGEVLVRVDACAINNTDVNTRVVIVLRVPADARPDAR